MNSFNPIILGKIRPLDEGTNIKLSMKVDKLILLMVMFIMGVLLLTFLALSIRFYLEAKFEPPILIILGMIIFGYGIMIYGFKQESRKSIRYLEDLFEAE
ncbi:MAG: hypothetical protein AAF696_37325 [Bacteroidota bacterium]